jgi:drug/metabolite transporter (DMT)-like permease
MLQNLNSLLGNPRIRLFAGAVLISFSPVLVRLVSVSPTTSGFYRLVLGGIALALFLILTGRKLSFTRSAWIALLMSAVFFALDLWFWHRSIIFVGPGLATLLANFQVFFMTAAGVILLRQRPTGAQLVAIPLAMIGLVMIIGLDWQGLHRDYQIGVIFGLLTAVCYAAYLLSMRKARTGSAHAVPSREIAVLSLIAASILGVAAIAEGESLAIPSIDDAIWLACYGVLVHAVGLMFIASSLAKVSTAQVGLALLLQPSLSFTWDVLFFQRPLTVLEAAGAVIALAAIYLGSRQSSDQA